MGMGVAGKPIARAGGQPAARLWSLLQDSLERRAQLVRSGGDVHAGSAQGPELVLRGTLAARDDGAGVAHALPRRGGGAGDEAHPRLLVVALDPGGRLLFFSAADLADEDHRVGLGVLREQ